MRTQANHHNKTASIKSDQMSLTKTDSTRHSEGKTQRKTCRREHRLLQRTDVVFLQPVTQ